VTGQFPTCRFCKTPLAETFVDLGETPLANDYVSADRLAKPDPRYPLHARVCGACKLVQVDAVTTPQAIFGHYAYFSSFSASWVEHARRFCEMTRTRFGLSESSQVIEVASNDGYLLKHFIAAGVPALGIEPAANVAEAAVAAGVPTEVRFFGADTARDLVSRGLATDLVIGNNVLAHVPDINDFVAGLAHILKPDGVVSVEFPHLANLINQVQFDTIYHEHYCYLSLLAVERIFTAHGLKVFDVEELSTHGGSLRVLACRVSSSRHQERTGLQKVRAEEAGMGLDGIDAYRGFETKVRAARTSLLAFLRKAKADGQSVAAYGAAAKGNTLLNYCGIGTDLIAYVVDRNPHKQKHWLPGSRLPIHAPEQVFTTRPDFVLILPWNLETEIMSEMSDVREWRCRFVIAIPTTRVIA
jgi:SAM-dependent methyltransferase